MSATTESPLTTSVGETLAWATGQLAAHSDSARLDAEVLLAHVIAQPRSRLLSRADSGIEGAALMTFRDLIARRALGEPVAYLTGWREFWSRPFRVTPATLIPRPETEHLVELTLEHLPGAGRYRIADLGTGSGAIALTLALERPACTFVATDISPAALAVARANAQYLGVPNVEFRAGEWCAALGDEGFDLIVSNPPYVGNQDPHLQQGDLRFEPLLALAAGTSGLDAIERIARRAHAHLHPGGWLILEHGYDQAETVTELLGRHGYLRHERRTDISGRPRIVAVQYGGGDRG